MTTKFLTIILMLLVFNGCDQKSSLTCKEITLNQTFQAEIGEEWCVSAANWKVKFGPFIEDSRCNVPGIDCVWAGRYVMAATFTHGETVQDTFFAVNNWRDTLYQGGYEIILDKIYPETRTSMSALPPEDYRFDVLVKQ